jgi:hypothetical protein
MQRNDLTTIPVPAPSWGTGAARLLLAFACAAGLRAQTLVQTATPTPATGATLSQTISFSTLPTVGNTVVVATIISNDAANLTAADNQSPKSNSYSLVNAAPPGSVGIQASIFCTSVLTSSGTFTITATNHGSSAFITMFASEYSGASCNPDQGAGISGQPSSPYACGTMTTRNAKDVLVSVIDWDGSGTQTFSISGGFTIEGQVNNGTTSQAGAYADQIVSSTGSFNPAWTVSANGTASCVNIALQAASGGGSGGPHAYPIIQ